MSNWEKTLIGTVLNDPPSMETAAHLAPRDFTGPNVHAWAEILALHSRQTLGIRSFTEALRCSPDFLRLSDAGKPEAYVQECLNLRGGEIEEYVHQVEDAATRRALLTTSALVTAQAQNESVAVREVLDYAEQQFLALRRNRTADGVTMADLSRLFIPRLEAQLKGEFQAAWTPGMSALREVINYAEGQDMIVVAGRPGDGKSSLLRYEARRHLARGKGVGYINLDNSEIEFFRNMVAMEANIDNDLLKDPKRMTEQQLAFVRTAIDQVAALNIRVVTLQSPTGEEIVRAMRKMAMKDGCDMLIVDYVQQADNGMTSRNDDVAKTSRMVRQFNLASNIPVFLASQLSRDIEKRPDHVPQLSDLRDSGGIEQDATIVIFPRCTWSNPTEADLRSLPENVNPYGRLLPRPRAVPVQMHIMKNRNGAIGVSSPTKWVKSTNNYLPLEGRAAEATGRNVARR